jgi:uncharacterized protein YbjQ (UPF0145 family)
MLISTCDVPANVNAQILGMVRGNLVFSKHIGRDMMAGLKSIAGGEIKSYTQMTSEARDTAEERMCAEAQAMGANAIYCMRYCQDTVMEGTIEITAYGTAVRIEG